MSTTAETTSSTGGIVTEEKKESTTFDPVTQSLAPSHILSDGRFVYLPPPTDRDRIRFFERSIARHGLLQEDLERRTEKVKDEEKEKKDTDEIRVHPLAKASAHLESECINELNRAINLSNLVSTGEYFGLSNIVDPSLEIPAASTKTTKDTKPAATSSDSAAAAAAGTSAGERSTATTQQETTVVKPESAVELQEEQRTKAMFVLKRKRSQFVQSCQVLKRHRSRLVAAVVAQHQPDQRLRQLRPHWRLVAPEHGRRALPHATRPTEVIACDVDVYWEKSTVALGRLASSVPRYATMELKENYSVEKDLEKWEREHFGEASIEEAADEDSSDNEDKINVDDGDDKMDVEKDENGSKSEGKEGTEVWTRAEPFAIADPSLGKLDADFDPKKVKMLTLQFDIEKASTGFCQSACLEPISTIAVSREEAKYHDDEKVLVALQHSLFCAKIFESMRRELAPDTEDIGQVRASAAAQASVWLAGDSEENFLPPPSMMIGDRKCGLPSLCVLHCHEGEVKVQLDCEYTLRVKLVEAGEETKNTEKELDTGSEDSGSQSPRQLQLLCRTLLLHSQEIYHRHSVEEEEKQRKQEAEERSGVKKQFHALRKNGAVLSPRILQSSVSLGSKILFERRIRKALVGVNDWLVSQGNESLQIEWLALSVFDFCSRFTLTFRLWCADVYLEYDVLSVTRFLDDGSYRKSKFYSAPQFELFLKTALKRVMKQNS